MYNEVWDSFILSHFNRTTRHLGVLEITEYNLLFFENLYDCY